MRRLNPDCTPLGASVSFVSSAKAVIGDERSIMHFGLEPDIRQTLYSAASTFCAASNSSAFFSTCSTICSIMSSLDCLWLCLPAR